MVGSRNSTAIAFKFIQQVLLKIILDYVICSGLAVGIDSHAHNINTSRTIAVMTGDISQIYPPSNNLLYNEIVEKGLVITEMPIHTQIKTNLFLKRNKFMVNLCSKTLIFESLIPSGTFFTGRYTLEKQKPLFVVPGHPLDKNYQGNNALLKAGAKMFLSHRDILQEEDISLREPSPIKFIMATIKESKLIDQLIGYAPITIAELINIAKLQPGVVYSILCEMQIAGLIDIKNHQIRRIQSYD